jgi:hypothetical protein
MNRKFSAAAERQRRELAKVRGQMASSGCGLFSSSLRCASLSRTASKMSANLNSLKAEAGRGSGRSRASLIAALEANNCRKSSKEVVVASRDNSPSLFSRLFGQSSAQRKRPADEVRQQEVKVRSANRSNVSGGRDRILRAGAASTGIQPERIARFVYAHATDTTFQCLLPQAQTICSATPTTVKLRALAPKQHYIIIRTIKKTRKR